MTRETPWLEHYDPGVKATLAPYPQRTLVDYVSDSASKNPRHPSILFKGSTISYAQLEQLSDACAASFAALGIGRGDRIALLLPNCPQFVVAQLGAWKIGAVVAPLNPLYTEAELEMALRESGAARVADVGRHDGELLPLPLDDGPMARPRPDPPMPPARPNQALSVCIVRWPRPTELIARRP